MKDTKGSVRILVADDHPVIREYFRCLLAPRAGCTIAGEAEDGSAAVDLARRVPADVLFLDLIMPRLAGMEVLRQLQENGLPVRVILYAARIEEEEIVEALKLGARGIIQKTSPTSLILKCLQVVVNGDYWVVDRCVTDVIEFLHDLGHRASGESINFGLTRRELQMALAAAEGCTNREIASRFGIREQTVKHHLHSVFDKLGVHTRVELTLFALNRGLGRRSPSGALTG